MYNQKRTYDNLPGNYIQIMVGDLNTRVGREEVFQRTAGKENLHLKSNGIKLIGCAASKDLIISSTQLKRKESILGLLQMGGLKVKSTIS